MPEEESIALIVKRASAVNFYRHTKEAADSGVPLHGFDREVFDACAIALGAHGLEETRPTRPHEADQAG